jgi:uncharacterized coiled-coil protein SlyX
MDSQFLEFWGNFFLSAAKGQKQVEDAARWMSQGLKASGFVDLADMFGRAYGLKTTDTVSASEQGLWEAAARQFNRSFNEYMALMGLVSGDAHRRLQEKCDALEKKCAEQEETISHLRKLLGADKSSHEEAVKKFQAILEKQSSQFQDLVVSSTRFLESTAAPSKPSKKR